MKKRDERWPAEGGFEQLTEGLLGRNRGGIHAGSPLFDSRNQTIG
jgi:hypothetical protein